MAVLESAEFEDLQALSARALAGHREASQSIDPSGASHDAREVSCAQCREPMQRRTIEDVEIDECTACGVYWFDQGELGAVLEARTQTTLESLGPHQAPLSSRERCAVCWRSTEMFRFNHVPHVAVDVCAEHGNWLDDWQGRELLLWGRKDAAQAEAARTTPYQRRIDRLRTGRAVWIVAGMYTLKSAALSTHGALGTLVLAFWLKDLVELIVGSLGRRRSAAH